VRHHVVVFARRAAFEFLGFVRSNDRVGPATQFVTTEFGVGLVIAFSSLRTRAGDQDGLNALARRL
jgi:hypothetical protein